MLPSRTLAIIVIVSAVALGGGVMTYAVGIPSSPCSGISGAARSFTIVASDSGFNDSAAHLGQTWPIMNVNRCDIVKITIINTVTQTHGFAIDYYAVKGTEIPGQQTLPFPAFQAVKTGNFRVYCTVQCTVHNVMLNGLLNVS
jgi:hypothetical protein